MGYFEKAVIDEVAILTDEEGVRIPLTTADLTINTADLTMAIERLKTNKIPENSAVKPAKRPVSKPPKTSQMREITEKDENETDHDTDETPPKPGQNVARNELLKKSRIPTNLRCLKTWIRPQYS